MKHLEFILDWWEDEKGFMDITDAEADIFYNLNVEDIYEHLRKSIEVVTPMGETKFVPRYEVGELSLSVQFSYYLWCERSDKAHSYNDIDNSPITEEEFLRIVGDDAYSGNILDVMVEYKGTRIIQPTQSAIHDLVADLYIMVKN